MKNTKENAQLILGKYCGLNDESAIGEAVLNAMIEYAAKVKKLNIPAVIKSVCEKCTDKNGQNIGNMYICEYCGRTVD
jgi:hypothetical protein